MILGFKGLTDKMLGWHIISLFHCELQYTLHFYKGEIALVGKSMVFIFCIFKARHTCQKIVSSDRYISK